MSKPLISFVIPVGNFNEYLNDAIKSIINLQNYNEEDLALKLHISIKNIHNFVAMFTL